MSVISTWCQFFSLLILIYSTLAVGDQQNLYTHDKNIFELTASTFNKVVHKSNYSTLVQFYAPWCGYSRQLASTYEHLAKLVHEKNGWAVNIAAVNCEKESNRQVCSEYQIKGFPTLLVFRPPKYEKKSTSRERHVVEPYQGERKVKAISAFLNSRMKNWVKKFTTTKSDSFRDWIEDNDATKKVILLTRNTQTLPLYKSLAINFYGNISFGMITLNSKNDINGDTITYKGNQIKIPVHLPNDIPALLAFDELSQLFVKYDKKLNDIRRITKWLKDVTNKEPHEGPCSKKEQNYLSLIRSGRRKKISKKRDEL